MRFYDLRVDLPRFTMDLWISDLFCLEIPTKKWSCLATSYKKSYRACRGPQSQVFHHKNRLGYSYCKLQDNLTDFSRAFCLKSLNRLSLEFHLFFFLVLTLAFYPRTKWIQKLTFCKLCKIFNSNGVFNKKSDWSENALQQFCCTL